MKRNFELKTTLVKASSRPPLSGSRLKRGPDQMKEALEPAKVRWEWGAESKKGGERDKDRSCGAPSLSLPETDTRPGCSDQN